MGRLARFLGRRLVQVVPTVLIILVINFVVLHSAPGDVVDILAGEAGSATPEYIVELRQRFGLDQPMLVQLGRYLLNAVTLDLGYSFRHQVPVTTLILGRLPATLLLMGIAIGIAILLGVVLGVTAARNVNRPADGVVSLLALLCYATPTFWIGLMMIVLFSVKLGWLPTGGMMMLEQDLGGLALALDIGRHAVLPATALALFYVAIYTRLMRASMLEVYGMDYVRTARAKGLTESRVAWGHVLRNAMLPIVTVAGLQVGSILGGAVLVETVFAWPGLGRLAYEAVFQRDFNLLLGVLLICSVLVIAVNIAVDLLYAWLDPRIEIR
jgi:peptide/nickel transport system permease protein